MSKRSAILAPARHHTLDLFAPPVAPELFTINGDASVVTRATLVGRYKGVTHLRRQAQDAEATISDLSASFDKAWLMSRTRPKSSGNGPDIRVVDLFAGCGGLSVGVQEAVAALGGSFASTLASDIDEEALSVYAANLSPARILRSPIEEVFKCDIDAAMSAGERKLRSVCGRVDFLIGGPPCQGHSDLNNHTRRNDPRNELYGVMARAARVVRPRYIIIENVLGVRHSSAGVVQKTMDQLTRLNYKTVSVMLNAATFGVAQNRKRHFTLAMTTSPEQLYPTLTALERRERPVMWAIDDVMEEADQSNETFRSAATHSSTNKQRIDFLFENDLYELPDAQRPDCHRLKPHAYNSVYGRMRPDLQAPTLTSGFGSTGQGRFVHPYERRTMTPHEAARIQFFPDWFAFGDLGRRKLQKVIGNAVPPKLGYALAMALLSTEGCGP